MTQRRDEGRDDERRELEEAGWAEADERRELEEAGWVLEERLTEKIIWRNPESGYRYTQETALARVRERARRGEPFGAPEEGSR